MFRAVKDSPATPFEDEVGNNELRTFACPARITIYASRFTGVENDAGGLSKQPARMRRLTLVNL